MHLKYVYYLPSNIVAVSVLFNVLSSVDIWYTQGEIEIQ